MTISTYFKRSEFSCKCGCGFDAVDIELLGVLEDVREHFGKPLVITSGNRCEAHNMAIGGADESKHIKGIAADIKVVETEPSAVYDYLESRYPDTYGMGLYKSWVHIDVRRGRARW